MEQENINHNLDQPQIQGRWDNQQHQKFIKALFIYGKNWKLIQKDVQTRTTAQVRSHAQKFFLKIQKIQKERKRNMKKGITQPSKIELDLIKALSQETITPDTPTQICQFLRRKPLNQPQKSKDQPEKIPVASKQSSLSKKSHILEEMLSQNEEESFLVSLIRYNRTFGDPHQALTDMIDFPEINKEQKYQEQTESKRKISFSQYVEEQEGQKVEKIAVKKLIN